MKKSTQSKKKRVAAAKRGLKNSIRKKKSRAGKHLRELIKQGIMSHREKKVKEMMEMLSGSKDEASFT